MRAMKVPQWLLVAGALIFLSPVFFIGAALLGIKYRPLPPVPRANVRYQIRDAGASKDDWRAFYSWNDARFGWQLDPNGRVIFDAPDAKKQQNSWKARRAARATQLKLRDRDEVWAIQGNQTLVQRSDGGELWRGKNRQARCRNRIAAYKKWPVYDFRLEFFGESGEVIGNGRIATAPASSGGASEPHGRQFPLFWDGESDLTHDLNEFVDAKSGFILFRALAVNRRGQILCLGQKTDARGAETPQWPQLRRLILTPRTSNSAN